MKMFFITFLLFLSAKAEADWGYPEEDDAVVLTPSNHEAFIRQYEEVLVYYYLPGCHFCVEMDKFFSKLSFEYKESEPRIPFAKFNCKHHLTFCEEKAIPTFPFIKFYIREHPLIYYGVRSMAGIRTFINKIMSRTPQTISTGQLSEKMQGAKDITAVFIGKKQKKGYHWLDLMSKYDELGAYFHIENNEEAEAHPLLSKLPKPLTGKTVVIKKDKVEICSSKEGFHALETCVYHSRHNDVYELTPEINQMISEGPQRWLILFALSSEAPEVFELDKVAKEYKKQIKFIVAPQDTAFPELLNEFKEALLVDDSFVLPQVRIFDTAFTLSMIEKYMFEGQISYNALKDFIVGVNTKHIQEYLKSEENQGVTYGKLVALNGKSFESRVIVENQDSVVLYHDDFHSNKKSSQYLDLLKKLAEDQRFTGVKFFTINGRLNELRMFRSKDMPVILLFSKRDVSHPRFYEGAPDEDKLVRFIETRKTLIKEKVGIDHLNTDL